jgi:hypothetical protein
LASSPPKLIPWRDSDLSERSLSAEIRVRHQSRQLVAPAPIAARACDLKMTCSGGRVAKGEAAVRHSLPPRFKSRLPDRGCISKTSTAIGFRELDVIRNTQARRVIADVPRFEQVAFDLLTRADVDVA